MYAPTPPSRFKRSTERKVGEKALRSWAFKNAEEEDRALESYEALSYGFSSASAAELTIDEDVERERRREAAAEYDLTGRVY